MREKSIESKLVSEVKRRGGIAPKFVSPGLDGVLDRLILLPGGRIAFAELKSPGKHSAPCRVCESGSLSPWGSGSASSTA